MKRDPQANPLGSEPKDLKHAKEEEEPTSIDQEPVASQPVHNDGINIDSASFGVPEASGSSYPAPEDFSEQKSDIQSRQSSVPGKREASVSKPAAQDDSAEEIQPVDWFDLPLLSKLETMHTLAEWQFQNPARLRTIMKTDDEMATWVSTFSIIDVKTLAHCHTAY